MNFKGRELCVFNHMWCSNCRKTGCLLVYNVNSNQIKSQRAGMTMDSSSGLEVQVLSVSWFFRLDFFLYLRKKFHQQFTVKCEVPCHMTKFEPCLTFGPPPCEIYPLNWAKIAWLRSPQRVFRSRCLFGIARIKQCNI